MTKGPGSMSGFDPALRFSFFLIQTLSIAGQEFSKCLTKMAATVYERDNSGANRSPNAMTVLGSGFHAVDQSGLQLLDSGFHISGTWILDYNR